MNYERRATILTDSRCCLFLEATAWNLSAKSTNLCTGYSLWPISALSSSFWRAKKLFEVINVHFWFSWKSRISKKKNFHEFVWNLFLFSWKLSKELHRLWEKYIFSLNWYWLWKLRFLKSFQVIVIIKFCRLELKTWLVLYCHTETVHFS